jgi:hypothetical protein
MAEQSYALGGVCQNEQADWEDFTVFINTNKGCRQEPVDSLEGIVVWDANSMVCPQMVI